ncbi:MAG: hypothetical protein AB7O86_05965 [Porticoccaceae bacterium]
MGANPDVLAVLGWEWSFFLWRRGEHSQLLMPAYDAEELRVWFDEHVPRTWLFDGRWPTIRWGLGDDPHHPGGWKYAVFGDSLLDVLERAVLMLAEQLHTNSASELQQLLDDWYEAERRLIGEFSGSIDRDKVLLHRDACLRAIDFDIEPPDAQTDWLGA